MIAAVRGWVTSIAAVAPILTVVQSLVPEGTLRKIAGFTGGLVLLAALLQPALRTDLGRLRLDPPATARPSGRGRRTWPRPGKKSWRRS